MTDLNALKEFHWQPRTKNKPSQILINLKRTTNDNELDAAEQNCQIILDNWECKCVANWEQTKEIHNSFVLLDTKKKKHNEFVNAVYLAAVYILREFFFRIKMSFKTDLIRTQYFTLMQVRTVCRFIIGWEEKMSKNARGLWFEFCFISEKIAVLMPKSIWCLFGSM